MRIGELARLTGVSPRALRYYEERGLLSPSRSASGQRHYSHDAVDKVRFVQDLYAAGLSSQHIVALLPSLDRQHASDHEREALYAERERVQRQITRLRVALRQLDQAIAISDPRL